MSNISNVDSTYGSGGLDTRTTLDSTFDATFQQANGWGSAIIAIETILGDGPTLKGSLADLVTRLAILLNADGTLKNTGFTGLTTDYGLLASSTTAMAIMNHTPIGSMTAYGGAAAPTHWLLCDGTAVNRITYAKLFTAISTAYGVGDGVNTFNLPDMRGRVPVGVDGAAARNTHANADTLGGVGGVETLTTAQLASHSHVERYDSDPTTPGANVGMQALLNQVSITSAAADISTSSAGSGDAHQHPFQTVNWIIFAGV